VGRTRDSFAPQPVLWRATAAGAIEALAGGAEGGLALVAALAASGWPMAWRSGGETGGRWKPGVEPGHRLMGVAVANPSSLVQPACSGHAFCAGSAHRSSPRFSLGRSQGFCGRLALVSGPAGPWSFWPLPLLILPAAQAFCRGLRGLSVLPLSSKRAWAWPGGALLLVQASSCRRRQGADACLAAGWCCVAAVLFISPLWIGS